jgi:hypothetical protein
MPLHLNLYHEVQKQKMLQRRDPLKFAGMGLGLVAIGLAGYYFLQLTSQRSLTKELKRLKSEFATLEPKSQAAQKRSAEIEVTMKQGESLVKRMEQRFYWAPVLEKLVTLAPREVQFTRMAGEATGDDVKRCTITLDGIAAGGDPRRVAEDLRRALIDEFSRRFSGVTANFRSLEDSPEQVSLDGKKVPAALFGINIVMERGDAPPQDLARTAQK